MWVGELDMTNQARERAREFIRDIDLPDILSISSHEQAQKLLKATPPSDLVGSLEKAASIIEKIANDKEFSHDVNGKPIREVWYVLAAKDALTILKGILG